MAEEEVEFKTGDKVWAKLPGYPHWPGRVEEAKNVRERKKIPPGYYLIFFYGTHETAIMATHELFQWNDENNKMWFAERDTVYFTDSLWEVENDPNVKRDAPLPGITAAPNLQEVNKYNPIVPPTLSDDEMGDLGAGADSSDTDSSGSESGSSSSSSSSSDSDFEKKKKERRKQASNKKKTAQAKVKLSKPRKRKASSSSGSEVENANVSSSSDDEAEKKFAKLTASVPKKSPKASATFIPKTPSAASPTKSIKSEIKQSSIVPTLKPKDVQKKPPKVKKTANSSDEEEALKKFAEKSEKDSTVVSQKKAEEEKIDSAQAESNLAAFLSESDENESKSEKKKEADTMSDKSEKVNREKETNKEKEGSDDKDKATVEEKEEVVSVPKKDTKQDDSPDKAATKTDEGPRSEEKSTSSKESKKEQNREDRKERKKEKSPLSSKNKLKKKLDKHQEKLDRERQQKNEAAQAAKNTESKFNRRSIIEESDSSNDESSAGGNKSGRHGGDSGVKRTSDIIPDVNKLASDKILDKLHFELMKSLSQKCLNHERAVTCLNEMKDYLTSDNLRKNPDVFISVKKIRKYKKDDAVQQRAEELFNIMKSLVTSNTDVSEQLSSKLQEERKKRHSEVTPQQNKTASQASEGSQVSATVAASSLEKDSTKTSYIELSGDANSAEPTAGKSDKTGSEVVVQADEKVAPPADEPDGNQSQTTLSEQNDIINHVNGVTKNDTADPKPTPDDSSSTKSEEKTKEKLIGANKPAVQYFFMRGSSEPQPTETSTNHETAMEVQESNDVAVVSASENGHNSIVVDLNGGGHTPTRDEIEDSAYGDQSTKMNVTESNKVNDIEMSDATGVSQISKSKIASSVVAGTVASGDGIDIDSALGI